MARIPHTRVVDQGEGGEEPPASETRHVARVTRKYPERAVDFFFGKLINRTVSDQKIHTFFLFQKIWRISAKGLDYKQA